VARVRGHAGSIEFKETRKVNEDSPRSTLLGANSITL